VKIDDLALDSSGAPALTNLDVIKLQSAAFLSVCLALSAAGVVRCSDMGELLCAHIEDGDEGAWTHVARAIALVLSGTTTSQATAPDGPDAKGRAFVVIPGGRAD
jgi:hypothetical protein